MKELQQLLDQLVTAGAPGAAGWVQDDSGPRQATSGLADLHTGRPMRPELRFRAGSLTKTLVATVVLQLVAEGRLALQDRLERWLPGILPYGEQVTIAQLLNHTSGVPHNWATVQPTLYRSPEGRRRTWTPQELVALVADQPPDFRPGTTWSYSNTGYQLAGLIVEAASGHPLGQQLHQRIIGPLGLAATAFPTATPDLPSPHARGYSLPLSPQGEPLDGPLLDLTTQDPSWAWAAGALVANLEDLTSIFRALLGGRLLPPELLTAMRPAIPVPPAAIPLPLYDRYGLGLLETPTPAGRLVGMVGGIPGFLSIVLATLDGHRQLAVMTNLLVAPAGVIEAFTDVVQALGIQLLS